MRCSSSIFLFIFQLLMLNKGFCYETTEAEEFEYDDTPVARSARSIEYDQFLFSKRDVIKRLLSYFRWPSSYYENVFNPKVLSEGVGGLFIDGDDVYTNGVIELEGTVPIEGSVIFSGPVKACGKVTIAGKCGSASGSSHPLIGQPLHLTPQLLSPSPSEITAPLLPAPGLTTPTPELPLIEPEPVSTIILPPIVIPAIVLPAYVLPELGIPSNLNELSGSGNVYVTGNEVLVNGLAHVEGTVPTIGEVTFSGSVPAKGTVTICATF